MFDNNTLAFDADAVFSALPGDLIVLLADSPRFTVVTATDTYLQNKAVTREAIIGKGLFEAIPFDKATTGKLLLSFKKILTNKEADPVGKTPGGAGQTFLNKPVLNAVGNVQYIIHSVHESSSASAAQAANPLQASTAGLEQSEARLRSLIKAAPLGIVLFIGRALIIEMPNQAFIDIIGKDSTIIGKPLALAMPELEGQPFLQILDDVYTSGKVFETFETEVTIVRDGKTTKGYYDFSYTPLFDANGEVYGIMDISVDATERVLARKALEESEQNLRNIILQAPVAMCILNGPTHRVAIANERMFELWGAKAENLLNQPIFEALPALKGQGFETLLQQVISTGEKVSAHEVVVRVPHQSGIRNIFVNFVYEPFRSGNGTITGVMAVAVDVTEQVLGRKRLEESEQQLQLRVQQRTDELQQQKTFISSILEASFSGIYSIRAVRDQHGAITDFRYLFANTIVAGWLEMSPADMVGKTILQLLPENQTNGFFTMFCEVLQKGEAVRNETHFAGAGISQWFDYAIVPLNDDAVVVTVQNITQQKLANLQIEQQRNLLDNIMQHAPIGIAVMEMIRNEKGRVADSRMIVANNTSEKFSGIPLQQILSKTIMETDPNVFSSPIFRRVLHTLQTGEPFTSQYLFEPAKRWLDISVAKMDDDKLITVFNDITTLKNAQLQIQQSEERLRAVFNSAQSGMFTFSPVYDSSGEIVDFSFVITNSNFASYVGQTPEVLNGALGSTWFPGYLHNGVFDMYKKTYLTGETLRKDVHYNVDQHDIYLDLKSTKIGGEVLVTFTDYTLLKKAQVQLEKYLEDLKRSNDNLEEFAYAASHDMKEPIRKIQVFTSRLKKRLEQKLEAEDIGYFARLESAAMRMGNLIEDLLEFSHVTSERELTANVDLNKKVQQVMEDLELEIGEKNAVIRVETLPVIKGNRRQLLQLFQNLISNALKFSKPGVRPEIHISSTLVKGKESGFNLSDEDLLKNYHLLRVADNGIGFEEQYADRIFNMFQRLHAKAEYSGTGLGLSIVRKVVYNHNGFVLAKGNPGHGAVFKILFPA